MINIIILALLLTANLGVLLIMIMVAGLVEKEPKKKTLEEAQAEFLKAWGDSVIEEAKKKTLKGN